MICQLSPTVGPVGEEQNHCLSDTNPTTSLCLTYCVCTDMFYSLSRGRTLTPITFPILVTVKKTSNIKANNQSQYGTYNGSLGTVSSQAVCCSLSHIMGGWANMGRVICKCPHTGWQPCWCMSVPNNPVVRHSRQKYAVANELVLRKLLILLTAVEHWRLQEEPNPSPVRHNHQI